MFTPSVAPVEGRIAPAIIKSAFSYINDLCSLFVTKYSQTTAQIVLKEHQHQGLYQGLDIQGQGQDQGLVVKENQRPRPMLTSLHITHYRHHTDINLAMTLKYKKY